MLAPLARGAQVTVFSGCALNDQGNIACSPESMRANAETRLKQLAPGLFSGKLSLEAYTLARYMQSEIGNGTIEERVAVGEAAVNRAKLRGKSVLNVLLYNQGVGHPNYGFYGPIHGPTGVTTAPYRRWASTRLDPSVLTLLLGDLIASGRSHNFARLADDQSNLFNRNAYPNPAATLQSTATRGNYWVGPLPGVDHRRTFLMRQYGVQPTSPQGMTLLARGIAAVSNEAAPNWSPNMPICSTTASESADADSSVKRFFAVIAAIGGLVGAGWLALHVAKNLATRGPLVGYTRKRR
jgi:hypothetical protein